MTDSANEPWTVLRLLTWTKEFFAAREIDSPRLAAEMLLAHVLECQRIELYARHDQQPDEPTRTRLRELVQRAGKHEPVAYLIGEKEFYSLRMKVTADVLIPRPETEGLVSETLEYLKQLGRGGKVWDVCTGSGCVAVAIASQNPDATVLATDISPQAVAVAAENAAAHELSDRVDCRVADLLAAPAEAAEFAPDVVVANPPYVADSDEVAPNVAHEPRGALYAGADGLDVIRLLVPAAAETLAEGGLFAMEFGAAQADDVRDLIVAAEFAEPRIIRDLNNIERIAVAIRK